MRIAFLLLALCACAQGEQDAQARSADTTVARPADPGATCGIGAETMLTGSGVGKLQIGASADGVRTVCTVVGDSTEMDEEGNPARVLRVDAGRDTLVAEVDSGRVWRITVDHRAFVTRDSLGVGTTLDRLLQFSDVSGLEGEGGLFVVSPSHCGLSFRLHHDVAEGQHRGKWTLSDLRTLPLSTPVDQVLLVGCEGA